jgi:alkyl sulfatase BDS1-like metallo-beta-lactamase superfamily hydrolase
MLEAWRDSELRGVKSRYLEEPGAECTAAYELVQKILCLAGPATHRVHPMIASKRGVSLRSSFSTIHLKATPSMQTELSDLKGRRRALDALEFARAHMSALAR